jgi:hypothetical protein
MLAYLKEWEGLGGRLTTLGPRSEKEPKPRRPVLGVRDPSRDNSAPSRDNSAPSRDNSVPSRDNSDLVSKPQPLEDSDCERVSWLDTTHLFDSTKSGGAGREGAEEAGPGSILWESSSTVVGIGLVSSLTVSGTSWCSIGGENST